MNINAALAKLDPENDTHWTADGAPRIEAVSQILGANVTRAQIVGAAPEFSRDNVAALPGGRADEPAGPVEAAPAEAAPPPALPAMFGTECRVDEDLTAEEAWQQKQARGLTPQARRYLQVSDEILKLQQQRGDLENRLAELSREQAALERWAPRPNEYDHRADQKARMDYIERQKELRAGRLAASQAAVAAAHAARAPIDAAMARRTQRGAQRPQYPVHAGSAPAES